MRKPWDLARSEESKKWTTVMKSGSNTVATRAKTSLCPHPPPREDMFEQIKPKLEPNLFLPGGETLSWEPKFRDQVITKPKLHGRGDDTTQPPFSSLASYPSSSIKREKNNSSILQSKKYRGGRGKPPEVGPPTSKKTPYLETQKPNRLEFKNLHICRDSFESQILRHVRSTGFDSILPHDLLH